MATIDSVETIKELIEHDGYFEDDPRVFQIVRYTNYNGNVSYGVTWENEPARAQRRYELETKYVIRPEIIWRANSPGFSSGPYQREV